MRVSSPRKVAIGAAASCANSARRTSTGCWVLTDFGAIVPALSLSWIESSNQRAQALIGAQASSSVAASPVTCGKHRSMRPRRRILLVDDDLCYRRVCRHWLLRDDSIEYEIIEAGHPDTAMTAIRENIFDCMVIDYRLPKIFGTELIEHIAEELGEFMPPSIVLTADDGTMAMTRAIRADATDFLSKGVTTGPALLRAIDNSVEKNELRQDLRQQRDALLASNAALERRNEEIGRFYHTVSHEIRTPLTGAREFVALVKDGVVGEVNPDQTSLLEDALACCDQITRQFADLLDMTRLETGKLNVELAPTNIETILTRCLAIEKPIAAQKSVTLDVRADSALPLIVADQDRLAQVISNLLANAVKFTAPGGRVRMVARADHAASVVRLRVVDNGSGISRAERERVFDRLYQINDHETNTGLQGLGLGLSIAQEIVTAHGGTLELIGRPGLGSSFRFDLHMANAKVTQAA